MNLQNLSAEDRRKHKKAILKVHKTLFGKKSPQKYYIVGQAKVLPPTVTVLADIDSVRRIRSVALGGLQYQVVLPGAPGHNIISVSHEQADRFGLWAGFASDIGTTRYTRFSFGVDFSELKRSFFRCIDIMVLEARASNAMRLRDKYRPRRALHAAK